MLLSKLYFAFQILLIPAILTAQPVRSRIQLTQGQIISITTTLKTVISQEAMNQAIDLQVEGNAVHQYTVTNATEGNYTVHHQLIQLVFNFDGMGQKRSFDSRNDKDMSGEFGKPVKELLDKTYDMIIDTTGKILKVQPDSIEAPKMDDRLSMIASLLKGLTEVVQPPAKGEPGFFKSLPDNAVDTGSHWTESKENSAGKSMTDYTLASVTDSTILINFTGQSTTVTKASFMGNETVTTMNHKSTGSIVLDRATGLLKGKLTGIESNGSTEAMGGKLPVTSRTTIGVIVM